MALVESSLSLAPAPQSDYMDDTAIKRRRLLAEQLLQQGSDASPIRSPWQGAARLVQGLMGGLHAASADAAEKDNADYNSKLMAGLLAPQATAEGNVSTAAAPQSPAMLTPPSAPAVAAKSDYLPAFAQAGSRWGVSPEYLTRTAQIESGMNPNAKNPSGAAGLMQFVPSTAKAYNLFNPFDPNASIDAAGHLAADNKRRLEASLHRTASDGELYLAHQQGAGGAGKLLANPDAPAASIVGEKAVLQNGGRPGMTAREFAGMWINKFGGAPAGGSPAASGTAVADASGGVPASSGQNMQAQRILAAMSDPRLSPQNKQMLMLMYQNATKDENRTRYSEPTTDAQGNLVQRDSNRQVHILRSAPNVTRYSPPEKDADGNLIQKDETGQVHVLSKAPGSADGVNHRHVIGGALVDDQGKVIYQAPEKAPMFTSEAVDDAAHALNLGDDSHLKNVGRGAQGAETIAAIRNKAAQFRRETNQSVADIMQASAKFGGDKARERTLGAQEANAATAAVEAGNALVIARKATEALGNTDLPPLNMAINAWKTGTGDPSTVAFGQAAATLANTYARAVNPKGLPHEAVLRDAIERMSAARSPAQLNALMDIMQREIEMSVNAPRQAREAIKTIDGGGTWNLPGAAPAGTTNSGVKWSVEGGK